MEVIFKLPIQEIGKVLATRKDAIIKTVKQKGQLLIVTIELPELINNNIDGDSNG